ncbi:molybdopterin-guanine dinucleotide biosynthesis protein B [Thermosulfurimonas marina]|uniref:Molybdopterin-guanine dinucleotide biosynthesis protein B n=1 Tax=Thermosulfurimonas marina TaxID=2047767 RepID=A0A6H1WR61_9BACT|nr:molybdopterin-guanine dinucleotide biosynthesis protein B [Thermosulfurimonas marina]QJA05671.1 molybdopterin-guanine dinucleotide biosynthesis protein B [Thermosulfurimonas marina]
MPPVITLVGPHAVGKTTVGEALVRILTFRGLSVGVLKSTKEASGETDRPGTDTTRYRAAGAQKVALWGREILVSYQEAPEREAFFEVLFRHYSDCDLVLAEGFKGLSFLPKIEVARKEISEKLLELPGTIAVVADFRPETRLPVFEFEEKEALADFISERLGRGLEPQVELLVDGRPVGLKRFVREALAGTLLGFLSSLRGVSPQRQTIEIRLNLPEKRK